MNKEKDSTYNLIKISELETAISDYFNPDEDSFHFVTSLLRELTIKTALLDFKNYEDLINKILPIIPDKSLSVSIQEGFAYYALYPEQYRLAAEKYTLQNKKDVVVIGLRNIGTALSAVVAAELIKKNINVNSFTLRPRGEWNNRYPVFSSELKNFISENNTSDFIIVDEGPGKTGTSISGTLKALNNLGVSFGNIFIFPSYYPDITKLDEVWSKCKIFVESYNPISEFNCSQKVDGKNIFDKLKYKVTEDNKTYFVKFIGLGEYGEAAYCKAAVFYENGFSLKPLKLKDGFIYSEYVDSFLSRFDLNIDFLSFAASYYSFIYNNFKSQPSHNLLELDEILNINLGNQVIRKIDEQNAVEVDDSPEITSFAFIDNKYIKTGNSNYPLRHILPGNLDIHYNIASFIIENKLNDEQANYFLGNLKIKIEKEKLIYFGLLYNAIKKAKEEFL